MSTPVELYNTGVHHPLLVVEGLAFLLLIGIDILRPHGAMFALDKTALVRRCKRVCDVCNKLRTKPPAETCSARFTVCAVSKVVAEPCTAAIIPVRVPHALRDAPNVGVEPFASLIEDQDCAALPSVHAPDDSVCYFEWPTPLIAESRFW